MPTETERNIWCKLFDNPDTWPLWPVLPLKRNKAKTEDDPFPWELGFLFDSVAKTTVYLSPNSIFIDAAKPKAELKSVKYGSFAAILADGWIVD